MSCSVRQDGKKTIRQATKDENGKVRFNGPIVRKKGQPFMVDTTMTGSECGTSDNPKFSLLKFFMEVVFPRLQEMTDTNGQFPGYHVVIQGDNAGPHTDKKILSP